MSDILKKLSAIEQTTMDTSKSNLQESAEKIAEVTPPGREKQVKALKKVPGIDNPWAVSWASYNKSHPKEGMMDEGKAEDDAALAKKIFKLIKKDYANQGFSWNSELNDVYGFQEFLGDAFGQRWDETDPPTVTDHFTALNVTRQRAVMKAVKQAVKQYFTAGSDYDDYRYGRPSGGRTFEGVEGATDVSEGFEALASLTKLLQTKALSIQKNMTQRMTKMKMRVKIRKAKAAAKLAVRAARDIAIKK
jgi:hypothetical protein